MNTMKPQQKRQAGFTILELMIATVVVSVILLMVTTVMISLQDLYYKGINQETVQNDIRNITNTVSQEIQDATVNEGATIIKANDLFSGRVDGTPVSVDAICVGSTRYMYVTGVEVGSDPNTQVAQALWRDSYPPGSCGDVYYNGTTIINPTMDIITNTPTDGGTAYISPGTRLTDFEVNPPVAPDTNYAISVAVAIGSDNLLTSTTGFNARCITGTGDQFCATASLLTEVGQRVQ